MNCRQAAFVRYPSTSTSTSLPAVASGAARKVRAMSRPVTMLIVRSEKLAVVYLIIPDTCESTRRSSLSLKRFRGCARAGGKDDEDTEEKEDDEEKGVQRFRGCARDDGTDYEDNEDKEAEEEEEKRGGV